MNCSEPLPLLLALAVVAAEAVVVVVVARVIQSQSMFIQQFGATLKRTKLIQKVTSSANQVKNLKS